MPGREAELTKEKPVSLGAPAWKKVFPGSLWPTDIPGGLVVGFWLSSGYKVSPNAPITNEFEGITDLNVLGAGTLGESLSFYMDVTIVNAGTLPAKATDAVDRAFFQYNHPSHKVNLTFGVFEPRAVVTSSHLRLMGISDYLANVYGMPPTGNSFSLSPNQQGIEGWGSLEGPRQRGGLEWFAGVVNGRDAGIPTGAAAYDSEDLAIRLQAALDSAGRTEWANNSNKGLYGGLNYKVGGLGVLGGGTPDEIQKSDPFRDNCVTLGAFWYRGVAPALLQSAGAETLVRDGNHFYRAAVKVDANFGRANLLAALQVNRDRLTGVPRPFDEVITLAEARYVVCPWVIPAVRWESLKPNFGPVFYRGTVHTSLVLRANVRLSLEGVWSPNSETNPLRDFRRFDPANASRFQVRLDYAF